MVQLKQAIHAEISYYDMRLALTLSTSCDALNSIVYIILKGKNVIVGQGPGNTEKDSQK